MDEMPPLLKLALWTIWRPLTIALFIPPVAAGMMIMISFWQGQYLRGAFFAILSALLVLGGLRAFRWLSRWRGAMAPE